MAFGSMLGARVVLKKKKKSSYRKENLELDGNGLGLLDFALGFGKGPHRSSTDGFG